MEKGEVIYGLKEYTFPLYLDYEISTLKEKYCSDTDREGMELTEDEIVKHYKSRDWIFGDSEENADLETARVAVERELREQKYDDMIAQREEDSQVEGNMEDINHFTLENKRYEEKMDERNAGSSACRNNSCINDAGSSCSGSGSRRYRNNVLR